MRYFTRYFTPLVLCLLIAVPAHAERMSAAELARLCSSKSDLDYGYCAGYIKAVADGMLENSIGGFSACNHAHVRSQQYVDVFRGYMEVFPEKLPADAEIAAAGAIARAFPCAAVQ